MNFGSYLVFFFFQESQGPGSQFPVAQRGSATINIASVTVRDQGMYVCVADNGQGPVEGRIQVTGKHITIIAITKL